MALDLILLAVFLGTASYAGLTIWRKIPILLHVPPQLIEESFVTRPPTVKRYAEPVIRFFRDGKLQELYYAALIGILHWIRLTLLRMERVVYRMLESLHERGEELTRTEERYWGTLKTWKHEARGSGNGRIPDALRAGAHDSTSAAPSSSHPPA